MVREGELVATGMAKGFVGRRGIVKIVKDEVAAIG